MEFSKEVKETFVQRLCERNVVVITQCYGNSIQSLQHKVIGVSNGLHWDFTPMIWDLTRCSVNTSDFARMAIRGFSDEIITAALKKIREEGIEVPQKTIDKPSDFYAKYYM